jgi:hypothetical protein
LADQDRSNIAPVIKAADADIAIMGSFSRQLAAQPLPGNDPLPYSGLGANHQVSEGSTCDAIARIGPCDAQGAWANGTWLGLDDPVDQGRWRIRGRRRKPTH